MIFTCIKKMRCLESVKKKKYKNGGRCSSSSARGGGEELDGGRISFRPSVYPLNTD